MSDIKKLIQVGQGNIQSKCMVSLRREKQKLTIEGRCNMNVRQYDARLNGKSWKKAGDVIIYRYKNSWQEQKTLEGYLILGRVR